MNNITFLSLCSLISVCLSSCDSKNKAEGVLKIQWSQELDTSLFYNSHWHFKLQQHFDESGYELEDYDTSYFKLNFESDHTPVLLINYENEWSDASFKKIGIPIDSVAAYPNSAKLMYDLFSFPQVELDTLNNIDCHIPIQSEFQFRNTNKKYKGIHRMMPKVVNVKGEAIVSFEGYTVYQNRDLIVIKNKYSATTIETSLKGQDNECNLTGETIYYYDPKNKVFVYSKSSEEINGMISLINLDKNLKEGATGYLGTIEREVILKD